MSLRAKNSGIKLSASPGKTKIRTVRSLLDMNMQVKEVNNKMELNIQFDQLQLVDLFRYLLEKSLKNHFGFVGRENEFSDNELFVNKEEKVSVYRIDRKSALSEREVEILEKLSRGWLNKQIADHFGLKSNTVRNHLQVIYLKLGVANRYEAIVKYRELFENVNKISSEN
ncbi:MAG: LuxR C-terminal-related transcriptional regulator [Bacteroidales bacterium]|nr:LuxR C-terminal-related transcriptional regulator [Bacteroidales bacterium]